MSEEYSGIKFSVEFISKIAPPPSDKLSVLMNWCKQFDFYNLAPPYPGGSAGNLSFRLEKGSNEFIITGTKIGLKSELNHEKFVLVRNVDLEKKRVQVSGLIEPSSESMLHWAVYKARPEINAIFHGHSEKLLLLSEKMPWTKTKNEVPYGSPDLVEEVLHVLGNNNFIIIKNHGFLSLGISMLEAGDNALSKL